MQELQRLPRPPSNTNEILGIRLRYNHRKSGKFSDSVESFFTIKLFDSPDKLESIGTVLRVKFKITFERNGIKKSLKTNTVSR